MYKVYGKLLFREMRTQLRHRWKSLAEKPAQKERGPLHVILLLAAAALTVLPSYIVYYLMRHAKLSISIAAIVALAMFLVGAYLIINLLKE
jgi:hypothetical protein